LRHDKSLSDPARVRCGADLYPEHAEGFVRVLQSEPNVDIRWLTFSPDGTTIGLSATETDYYSSREGSGTGTELWDVVTGERRPLEDTGLACPQRFCFHPSGRWLLGPGESGGLVAFDLTTQVARVINVESPYCTNVLATADGRAVVYYHYARDRSNRGYGCREWAPEGDLRPLWTAPTFLDPKGDSRTFGFILLADGNRILTAEREGAGAASTFLAFRSLDTGEVLASVNIGSHDQPTLAAAPDDLTFVVLSKKNLMLFRGPKLIAPFKTLPSDGRKHFTGVAFHPSGKYLAATSNDETVKLYDTATWQVARTFTWSIGKMRSIAFSPDGTLAAAGSDQGRVVVWDVDV
jgi:WD40 repeat protein